MLLEPEIIGPIYGAAIAVVGSITGAGIVAFFGLRSVERTIKGGQEDRLWQRKAEAYADLLATLVHRQAVRRVSENVRLSENTRKKLLEELDQEHLLAWTTLQGRINAFGAQEVEVASNKAANADVSLRGANAELAFYKAGLGRVFGPPGAVSKLRKKVDTYADELEVAELKVVEAIRRDLGAK